MSKVKKFFLPVLMIFATFFYSLPQTTVSALTNDAPGIVQVIGSAAEEKIDATFRLVEEGKGTVAPTSALRLEGSIVYTVGGGVTAVSIPLHGDYSLSSNITVFFDEDDNVLQTNEMFLTKNVLGNFQVSTYLNGTLVKSQDIGIAYMTDEELLAEEPSMIQPRSVGDVATCLVVAMDIGGTLAYAIAVACGGSCAAPTPVTAVICAACIGAYAVLGAGTIAGAVSCFNYL
ncbi:hypothetical protein ACVNNN_12990 [Lysinibacillus fusiformis]|uniref:hypothetical protein n=1 Tax=Lysinibacillus TaxID=400634 RepID=UPI0019686B70|nr:hypothetical protein [Lysinibacillus fusiformis]QSB09552.1 hypothetical protein JTI58_21615 [Lysinibacillus fusiformis]